MAIFGTLPKWTYEAGGHIKRILLYCGFQTVPYLVSLPVYVLLIIQEPT